MEYLKRKILLENFVDRDYNSPKYGTVTASTFYLNVFLTQTYDDIGIFKDVVFIQNQNINPSSLFEYDIRHSGKTLNTYYYYNLNPINYFSDNRNEELKTYKKDTPFIRNFDMNTEVYRNFLGKTISGVTRVTNISDKLVYVFDADKTDPYIGTSAQTEGLVYVDTLRDTISGSTIYFRPQGINPTNSSLSGLTKEEYLLGIISSPEVQNDVFIDRGNVSVFERHFKLSEVSNIGDLVRYNNNFFKVTRY